MYKKYILPVVLIILSIAMLIGSREIRAAKAAFFGRTLFFPFVHSLKAIESNQALQKENFILRSQITESTLQNLALQNELKEYLDVASVSCITPEVEFELAEVIGFSGQFQERNLIVNKGRMHGIAAGSAVISGPGIVGKIVSVTDTYSIILPFSSPRFQVPVMDQRTSVQGILQSDIAGTISMNLVKLGSEIAAGDTIVTSNLSRLYPKGYPVGTISRIRESTDNLFISAEITAFTLVENLEHVYILKERN
ncbi:MAG: rod shape-determining protein MreC [Candidatus Cloacimonetes bacterium]|jgi:rod shape-determining protein MreC|nr:rod shape-determining protein MreC [Candidatus Cloacimonadota bacterium]MCB5287947.1 rod shape-determining protein MreC [Candidatus Cloacimonadota bacterium]MCK9185029.1 rod shape-determining protein MreC [Candidatus Cloacimonadota bacterium]MCK9585120.1 rod shape-determining protein MreC [Candidatus Cloacimonadota bacterium]MDY0230267.1 rod shape-determining protein MreC [Candidatus Cloacimonadaceae bacterium]